ncbi:hypothetical protein ACFFQF_18330 [Haladaptatus pallidirubidus]|nr:hypothetical protein [Haladaptatus pallidirubidus]
MGASALRDSDDKHDAATPAQVTKGEPSVHAAPSQRKLDTDEAKESIRRLAELGVERVFRAEVTNVNDVIYLTDSRFSTINPMTIQIQDKLNAKMSISISARITPMAPVSGRKPRITPSPTTMNAAIE